MTDHAELIAEARDIASGRWQPHPDDLAQFATAVVAAIEAQPAPLVADSREALAALLPYPEGHGYDIIESRNIGRYRTEITCDCGQVLWWGEHEGEPTYDAVWGGHLADALLASGVVSLAADRDRATAERAWDDGHAVGYDDAYYETTTLNPYRESETRNG